jgi:aspartyl-tRNA(Asn)/glutamyl-tRNA(Gln) amidotransferase subunit B
VLNRRAVEYAIRAATALQCTVHERSVFARKNYFYPDLPKGYQITQYELPLATGGVIEYASRGSAHRVGIVRVHLEEDAGKSLHEGFSDSARSTYVDFNRSGVPLIEIVTAPDLRNPADAAECFSRLRAILVALDVNDGNMEEGSLRCDANVSVRPAGEQAFGVKTEVKNVNSFRYLQRALEFEIERQTAVLKGGGRIIQETRLFDSAEGRTVSMRSKEEAHDYRYFPEPDLPPLTLTPDMIAAAREGMPELPEARRQRFVVQYRLPEADAVLLSQTAATATYFEKTAAVSGDARATANWMLKDLQRKLKELGLDITASPVGPERLAELVRLVVAGAISGPVAKQVFERMCESGEAAEEIVRREGLGRIDDAGAIEQAVAGVLREHPRAVEEYRAGRTKTFGFLVGQAMKATGGKANPELVNAALKKALG